MIKNYWLLFIITLNSFALNAQKDFRPGFILLHSGDTLRGEIDYRGDLLMGSVCRFKIDNTEKEYSPAEIKGYRFNDDKYFVSKEIMREAGKQMVFLEFLINGKLNVYYYRDSKGDHYFIQKDNFELKELPYVEVVLHKNDHDYTTPSTKHIGLLNYYLNDAPNLKTKIEHVKVPERENLIKLAEQYHYEVCKDESCIVYKKKLPPIVINVEIPFGLIHYKDKNVGEGLATQNYYTSGILMHIWMPKTSEKLFFRTGILYSRLSYLENEYQTLFKVPVHFEYMLQGKRVSPRISFGVNFYNGFRDNTVSLSTGLTIKVSKRVGLMLSGELEFYSVVLIFPKGLVSSNIMPGLYIKL